MKFSQLITGKESFLMKGYSEKYNYEKYKDKFIKAISILYIAIAIFLEILIAILVAYTSVIEMLVVLIFIVVLIILFVGRYIILKQFTNNLENRKS